MKLFSQKDKEKIQKEEDDKSFFVKITDYNRLEKDLECQKKENQRKEARIRSMTTKNRKLEKQITKLKEETLKLQSRLLKCYQEKIDKEGI